MKARVTLRDIAAEADVHYSTVSLALRDHPRVSAPVRDKIKAIARKLGYTPDPALAALNAYRKTKLTVHYQSTLAWIDTWTNEAKLRLRDQPTFNEYYLGAGERARQLGYELEEFRLCESDMSPQRLSRVLNSRGITGLLLPPLPTQANRLPLEYKLFSTISFGYSIVPHVFHLVTNHQFHSVSLALDKITELGYQRIGLYLHDYVDNKTDNAYTTGYWRYCQRHPDRKHVTAYMGSEGVDDRELFQAWYLKNRPDVVISDIDHEIDEWLGDLGVRVPEDVGCAWLSLGADDKTRAGVDQNGRLIGQTAVDFLVGMLQRGEHGIPATPVRILVEGTWRQGTTLRAQQA